VHMNGSVAEFDSPAMLLEKTGSFFSALVRSWEEEEDGEARR
jgi:hypothetical protein